MVKIKFLNYTARNRILFPSPTFLFVSFFLRKWIIFPFFLSLPFFFNIFTFFFPSFLFLRYPLFPSLSSFSLVIFYPSLSSNWYVIFLFLCYLLFHFLSNFSFCILVSFSFLSPIHSFFLSFLRYHLYFPLAFCWCCFSNCLLELGTARDNKKRGEQTAGVGPAGICSGPWEFPVNTSHAQISPAHPPAPQAWGGWESTLYIRQFHLSIQTGSPLKKTL